MASDGGNHWDDEPRIELRGDPAYRQRGLDYGAEPYYEEEVPQEQLPQRRFTPLRFALAGLALLVFVGLLLYAYSWGGGDPAPDELPLIAAPAGVEKEPPSNPGGMEVPYQDSMVLNPGAAREEGVERLLPPPEEPQPRESLTASDPEPQASEPAEAAIAAGQGAPAPQPDGSLQGSEIAEEPLPAPEEPMVEEAPAAAAALPSESKPEEPAEAASEPAKEEPAVETATAEPAAPAAPASASATSGAFMIQLASASNRDAIQGEWAKMQQRHPGQLGNLQLHIEEADLGERGIFYRLQAGPLASREAAEGVCAQLKAQQQDCLVRAR